MKTKMRFFTALMALVMMFTSASTVAFAAETTDVEPVTTLSSADAEESTEMITEISMAEAAEFFGVSEDELDASHYYLLNVEPMSTNARVTIPAGQYHFFPYFTFTGSNVGSEMVCNGNEMSVSIKYVKGDNQTITVGLFRTEDVGPDKLYDLCMWDETVYVGENATIGWVSIRNGGSYTLQYFGGKNSTVAICVGVR